MRVISRLSRPFCSSRLLVGNMRGAGVGGGSLVYAAVLLEPKENIDHAQFAQAYRQTVGMGVS